MALEASVLKVAGRASWPFLGLVAVAGAGAVAAGAAAVAGNSKDRLVRDERNGASPSLVCSGDAALVCSGDVRCRRCVVGAVAAAAAAAAAALFGLQPKRLQNAAAAATRRSGDGRVLFLARVGAGTRARARRA